MSKSLNDLDPRFRPLAEELLRRIKEAGIEIVVIDTLRTEAEHLKNLKNGTSKVKRSKHCDGLAIDIAPVICLKLKNWAPYHPLWKKIGLIGEALGLRWGGRWKSPYDPGHFEYVSRPNPLPQTRSRTLPIPAGDDAPAESPQPSQGSQSTSAHTPRPA